MPKPPSKVLKEIPYKLLKTITGDFSKLLGSGTLRTVFKVHITLPRYPETPVGVLVIIR